MEEQIKSDSLKDVLAELQKLQLEYYGKCYICVGTHESGGIDVYIGTIPYDGSFGFSDIDDSSVWKSTYQKLLEYLKQTNNEE